MDFTLRDIATVTGGTWASAPSVAALTERATGVTIDSRAIRPGDLFVALEGTRVDGRDFVDAAQSAGAAAVLAEPRDGWPSAHPERVLLAPDARAALAALATAHRARLTSTAVIAVTGSVGKTTTCRLIDGALSSALTGRASPRSFNNDLGAPLTVLSARPTDEYLVCEIGASASGEIDRLAAIVRPDIAVITGAGRAHLEGFGTIETVACEKAALARAVTPGGVAIVASGSPHLECALASATCEIIRVGSSDGDDGRIEDIEPIGCSSRDGGPLRPWLRVTLADGGVFEAPVAGRALAVNIALAVTVARRLGLDAGAIGRGLSRATPAPMRFEPIDVGGVLLINDAYNANPESVAAALEAFGAVAPAGRCRVVVLGDMLELGSAGPAAHREAVHAALAVPGLARLTLIGPLFARAGAEADDPCIEMIPDASDEALAGVAASLTVGAAVLLKGSRGMRLERIAEALAGAPADLTLTAPAGRPEGR